MAAVTLQLGWSAERNIIRQNKTLYTTYPMYINFLQTTLKSLKQELGLDMTENLGYQIKEISYKLK